MDIVATANIDTAVAYIAALIIKTEYVAGLNGVQLNMHTVIGLSGSGAVKAVAKLLIHIPDKTGTVKTFLRAFCAVEVIITYILTGKIRNGLT